MRDFESYNPISLFVYFAGVTLPVMLCRDWLLPLAGACGALLLSLFLRGLSALWDLALIAAVTALFTAINPLFNHNGASVVFLINDMPVTLEATAFGAVTGLMTGGVLVWLRCFSRIMTSDRLLYVFGAASPRAALILSMTLRYIPLYRRQSARIAAAGRGAGMLRDGTMADRIRAGAGVFSAMVTWGLENGLVTADSMEARGYGSGRRTRYSPYRWRTEDIALLAAAPVLSGLVIYAVVSGNVGMDFYPLLTARRAGALSLAADLAYGLLAALPALICAASAIYWKLRPGRQNAGR